MDAFYNNNNNKYYDEERNKDRKLAAIQRAFERTFREFKNHEKKQKRATKENEKGEIKHSFSSNLCRLEDLVRSQQETIDKMENKIDCIQQTVYQLIGGLYNYKKQRQHFDFYVDVLHYGKPKNKITKKDTSKWTHWPTTKQGYDNEERIAVLEAEIELLKTVCQQQNDREEQDSNLLLRKRENAKKRVRWQNGV
jgi:hypothetical protein